MMRWLDSAIVMGFFCFVCLFVDLRPTREFFVTAFDLYPLSSDGAMMR